MKLSELSVRRPVTIVMMILIILLLGAISFVNLNIDLFPEMDLPIAAVIATYSGAAPEEMEELITKPLEAQMSTVHNIDGIQSFSARGTSIIAVMFNYGTDMDNATLEMREKVDLAQMMFPSEAEKPMVMKMDPNMMPVMALGFSSDMPAKELKTLIEEEVQNKLERIDGVASADIMGGAEQEIQVTVDPQVLQNYGLSIDSVVNALRMENRNVSAGDVAAGSKEYLVRVLGEFQAVEQVGDVTVTNPQGVGLKLSDIADVKLTDKEVSGYITINGSEGIAVTVSKETDGNTVEVSRNVRKTLEELETILPDTVEMKTLFDQAEFIELSINNLVRNIIIGGTLAILILLLFLRDVRSTLVIGTAIPISLIATFTLVYFRGMTLNMMTLGGLALGAGMMVDNSIIVLENIFRHRQEGEGLIRAAIEGSSEMANAILASTLTTIAVFLPIVFVEGLASQLFTPMAFTITFALAASLLVALTLVPMMSSKVLTVMPGEDYNPESSSRVERVFHKSQAWFDAVDAKYRDLLQWAINHRKTVVGITVGTLVLSLVLVPFVGVEFIPETDQGFYTVDITMDKGSRLEETEKIVAQVDKIIADIPETDIVFTTIGMGMGMGMSTDSGSDIASFQVGLVDLDQRERSTAEVVDEVRTKVEKIPGAEITVSAASMTSTMGGGTPVSIQIKGEDIAVLEPLAEEMVQVVSKVEGTREVKSSIEGGAPEVNVVLDRTRIAGYGLTPAGVANSIQASIMGTVATRYRTGDDEIDVRVRFSDSFRENLSDLSDLSISTPTGAQVPLEELGELEISEAPTSINRDDQERVVTVSSQIFGRDLGSIMKDIQERVDKEIILPDGYSIEYTGESEEMAEAFGNLTLALILAIILVYMVLAAEFESLMYPFIIMFAMPVTIVGVVLGLFLTGRSLSVPGFIGVIMLAGIVVNNGIVLVDYINQQRAKGLTREEAILKAGPHRLRPILMTTLTTILAMLPMTLGIGEGAELQAPLGTVVVGGLTTSTVLTLVVVPVMYIILDNIGLKLRKKLRLNKGAGTDATGGNIGLSD
jgi:HAE1 family hydrophobic/amphiphilic exporter-1